MDYLNKLYKFGELIKVLKLHIVVHVTFFVVDYLDLPSRIISKYGLAPFLVIFAGVCILSIIYVIQNHILNFLKNRNINELDSIIVLNIVFDTIYLVFTYVTLTNKLYKAVILLIIILVSAGLFIYRLSLYKRKNINGTKNVNVYDLKDFIEADDIQISNDYPILFAEKDVDYDLFNRDIIINQLYTSIQACKGADFSFVIGLEGAWGTGKTTVVNNVINKITENSDDDFIVINDFDPWTYNNQETLLVSLFDKILKGIGINYSTASLKSVVNTLFESIENATPLGGFVGNVFLRNDSDDNIEKLKNQICDYLKQNNKTIIIFIDNLDRASSENIVFLLKVINNIFDLKRVVYVLSYDKERVNDLLDNAKINEKYIEKIIQQEISITKLNREKLHIVVRDCITKLFVVYGVPKESYNNFSYIIDYLSSKISDIREFKRILNSVAPILSMKNELYKPDLFALELIKFTNNDFYEEIYNNAQYFICVDLEVSPVAFRTAFRKKEYNNEGKEFFARLESVCGKEILTFASNIFPTVKRYLNNDDLRSEYETKDQYKDISLNCGVASAKYFDSYFHFNENEYFLISKVYNNFITLIRSQSNAGNYHEILISFDELFDTIHKDFHDEFFNKLWLARNELGTGLNHYVLIGLINNSEKISKESGFLSISPYQRACAIMATLFTLLSEDEKAQVITRLKKDIKLLDLCSQIMYWLGSSTINYRNNDSDVAKFETLISDMYNAIVKTPIDIYCTENYRVHNSWALLRAKRKILGLDDNADVDITDYISTIMKPQYIYSVLKDMISISNGSKGHGYFITEKSLKRFFENDDIISEYLNKYPPTNSTEKFICDVFENYKSGDPDEFDEKAIYPENYVDLY